jgi:hypothetical protein
MMEIKTTTEIVIDNVEIDITGLCNGKRVNVFHEDNKRWVAVDDEFKSEINMMLCVIKALTCDKPQEQPKLQEWYDYFKPLLANAGDEENE